MQEFEEFLSLQSTALNEVLCVKGIPNKTQLAVGLTRARASTYPMVRSKRSSKSSSSRLIVSSNSMLLVRKSGRRNRLWKSKVTSNFTGLAGGKNVQSIVNGRGLDDSGGKA